MSTEARMILGVVTLVAAGCSAVFAAMFEPAWPWVGLAAFCTIVALACLVRRSRPVTLRIIGSVIFAICLIYAVSSIAGGARRQTLLPCLLFGIPAGLLAVTGKYPAWGPHGSAFQTEQGTPRASRGGWAALILAFAIGLLWYSKRQGWLGPFAGWIFTALLLLLPLAVILVMFGLIYWRHRAATKPARLAQAGDVAGAVALMRDRLEESGPSALIYNDLGIMLGMQNQWEESLRLFEQASLLPDQPPALLPNKGLALWKLGRREEALTCLEECCRRDPRDFAALCNYAALLAEIGRRDEALVQLSRAERIHAELPAADHAAREQALDGVRANITLERE